MKVYNNILDVIGETPIVRLNKITGASDANVYAKLEFLNPGGSIKDRIALHIINKAEKDGMLKKGGTIVENTSGNTGAGLAIVSAVRGYKAIFTIPDKMSSEKINFLKAFGAKVVVTPTNVPADSPQSYYETAKRIHQTTENSFYVNQYHNPENPEAHYNSTGPEIWDQMDGKIDYIVAGIGTGGTLSGVARYLKEKNPDIKVIAVDPVGSVFYDYFKSGKLIEPHVYKVEGVGEDMLVDALDFNLIDDIIQVNDKDSFMTARDLARNEGIFAGGSSGSAVWGALQIAKKAGPGKNILTILPDTGFRYLSKLYNDEWMQDNGLIEITLSGSVGDLLKRKPKKSLISTDSSSAISDVIRMMKDNNISQMPVIDNERLVGLITENNLLNFLIGNENDKNHTISDLIETQIQTTTETDPISDVLKKLKSTDAVLVLEDKKVKDILTKIDLIDLLA
ncbi:MAG: pyridoxal-phosphate dependent enzyme [Calditrichaceae bacterium]